MSQRNRGPTSLPPLDDLGFSLSGRSPRQKKMPTSYEYRPDSASPQTSPRSPTQGRRSEGRNSSSEIDKEFRAMCIGSPIPATDSHHDDLTVTAGQPHQQEKHQLGRPRPFRKTPSIIIDRVEELNLLKDTMKSPRGGSNQPPLSPVSYDLTEHMPTTPFAKSKSSDRLLMISPTTPPVERKGNRQVVNYCRSDGHLASSVCTTAGDGYIDEDDRRRHNRSKTDGNQDVPENRLRGRHRDLTPSPRLTRRAREKESTWPTSQNPVPSQRHHQRGNSSGNEQESPRDQMTSSSSPKHGRRRRKNTSPGEDLESISPRSSDIRKPARLEPLNKK